MSMKSLVAISLFMATILSGIAGPFLNLDFELANTNTVLVDRGFSFLAGQGATQDLLPSWEVSSGNFPFEVLNFNRLAIGSGSLSSASVLSGEAEAFYPDIFKGIGLTGKYMFYVQTGEQPLLMSQIGNIPHEATELKLFMRRDSGTYLKTYLNGTEIVDGNISAFSGRENVQLTLEFGKGFISGFTSPDIALDRIEFIPEPSTYGLSLLGGGVLAIFGRARWCRAV